MTNKSPNVMRPDADFSEYYERAAKCLDAGWSYAIVLNELRKLIKDLVTPPIVRKGAISYNIQCFDFVQTIGVPFCEYLNNRKIKK